jgi:endoglucanase
VDRRPDLSRILRNARSGRRPTRSLLAGGFIFLLLVLVVCWRLLTFVPSPSSGSSGQLLRPTSVPTPSSPAPQLHIENNLLVDSNGNMVRLTGANRSGTEYRCLDYSVFDGPNSEASIDAMLTWHINAIRVPLNEDCWLGINLKVSRFGGDYYRDHILSYVELLISNGITPILDLHWSAPGTQQARKQQPMPDRDHSVTFWQQVATSFKGNNAVIFDLFNEPFPDDNHDTLTAWQCWRYGTDPNYCPASTAGLHYAAAGMQELVSAVRKTGAINVILLGGIQYASTLDHWMQYKPFDPLQQLAASWHLYNFSACNQPSCWYSQGLPLMKAYAVITGEIGEDDRKGTFITKLMRFLDNPGDGLRPQGYLAWVWNTDQTKFDLIKSYSGEPTTSYGKTYMDHLLAMYPPIPRQPAPGQRDTPDNGSYSPQLVADRRAAPVYNL